MWLTLLLKNWRWILAAGVLVALFIGYRYICGTIAERDDLRTINKHLSTELGNAQKTQELTNRVTEAISQIRIRSNINVTKIEREPKPEFVDADPIPFIAGGVLPAVYSPDATGGVPPGHETGAVMAAESGGGGVLPDRSRAAEHPDQSGIVPGGPGVGTNDTPTVQRDGQGD